MTRTITLTDHEARILDCVLSKVTKGRTAFQLQGVPIDRKTIVAIHKKVVVVLPK